jgi:uncharacterized Zn-binding protein involved in type VI secretion
MPNLSRLSDTTVNGGRILRGAGTVIAEGRPVGLHTSAISPHPSGRRHKSSVTTAGSGTVICEGSPVLHIGSPTSCGHPVITGCSTVVVAP